MNQISKRIQYTLPDGSQAYFSRVNLKTAIHRAIMSYEKKISQQCFLEEMAEATGNSFSAIKHWLAGHNAPSDLEKLQVVADFLKVELTDLLDTEMENKTMTNNVAPTKAVDFSETKNTIRDLYIRMVNYIEMFRTISINHFNAENNSFEDLAAEFPRLYTSIMYSKLDLPNEVFCNLRSFSVNYLQQMFCYLMFYTVVADNDGCLPEKIDTAEKFYEVYSNIFECNPWYDLLYVSIDPSSKESLIFEDAVKQQYRWNDDEENPWLFYNEIIINTAYTQLEELLNGYLMH